MPIGKLVLRKEEKKNFFVCWICLIAVKMVNFDDVIALMFLLLGVVGFQSFVVVVVVVFSSL